MESGLVDIAELVRDAEQLAPLPASTTRLACLLADEDRDLRQVADTIRLDEALTGRLLGAANSASSGPRQEILDVEAAVVRLGPGRVLSLALSMVVGPHLKPALPAYGMAEGELWSHSILAALAVECSARHCRVQVPAEAFVAALLHDVGKLVLARHLSPDAVEAIQRLTDERGMTSEVAERALLSIGHAQLGARVARGWGLPEPICLGIEHHHTPLCAPDVGSRRLCSLILLGDAVATALAAACDGGVPASFSPALAGSLGITQVGFEALCEDVRTRHERVLALYV